MRIRGNINISPDFFIGNRMNDGGQDDEQNYDFLTHRTGNYPG